MQLDQKKTAALSGKSTLHLTSLPQKHDSDGLPRFLHTRNPGFQESLSASCLLLRVTHARVP